MFKYLAILVLALAAVMAAPPAPEAAAFRGPAPAPRDLNTASQLVYSYGAGYPAYGYSTYGAYPAYGGYAYYG